MYSKTLLLFLYIFTAFLNLSAQNKKETLNDLIEKAVAVSPKIKMLEAKLSVAASKIEQGTNLPDPVLSLGLMNLPVSSFSFTEEPMTGKTIGLSQMIPYPGGLSAAADVKAMDTAIVKEEINDLRNAIKRDVAKLYTELRMVRGELALMIERIDLLKQILNVVKTKSEVGQAGMHNILKVEFELAKVKDKIEMQKGKEKSLISEMNTILLRDVDEDIETDTFTDLEIQQIDQSKILKAIIEYQPKLKEIKLSKEKAMLMEEEAWYEFYPNFNLGLQYTQRDKNGITGNDFGDLWSVMAGISIPINYGGKKTAKVADAKYMQHLYSEKYDSEIQDLTQELGIIEAKIEELGRRNNLISKTLLPLSEQSLKISLSDYQTGKIDFINVITTEKEILDIKTDLFKIKNDYVQKLVVLEYLTGFRGIFWNSIDGE